MLAVLSNVVIVNWFYDVPVMLFSGVYVVMTSYVLSPDARRLWTFFLGDGPAPPRDYLAPLAPDRRRVGVRAVLVAFVLGVPAADTVHKAVQRRVFTSDVLEGMWTVTAQSGLDDLLSDASARTRGDERGWLTRIYFEKGDYGFIRGRERRVRFVFAVDQAADRLRLSGFAGGASPTSDLEGTFSLQGQTLQVQGDRSGRAFSLTLSREFPASP